VVGSAGKNTEICSSRERKEMQRRSVVGPYLDDVAAIRSILRSNFRELLDLVVIFYPQ
jgi:hypothetical protein